MVTRIRWWIFIDRFEKQKRRHKTAHTHTHTHTHTKKRWEKKKKRVVRRYAGGGGGIETHRRRSVKLGNNPVNVLEYCTVTRSPADYLIRFRRRRRRRRRHRRRRRRQRLSSAPVCFFWLSRHPLVDDRRPIESGESYHLFSLALVVVVGAALHNNFWPSPTSSSTRTFEVDRVEVSGRLGPSFPPPPPLFFPFDERNMPASTCVRRVNLDWYGFSKKTCCGCVPPSHDDTTFRRMILLCPLRCCCCCCCCFFVLFFYF